MTPTMDTGTDTFQGDLRRLTMIIRDVLDRLAFELGVSREPKRANPAESTGLLLQMIHSGTCGRPVCYLECGTGRNPVPVCIGPESATVRRQSIPLDYTTDGGGVIANCAPVSAATSRCSGRNCQSPSRG